MNEKKRGILQIFVVVAAIAALGSITWFGIGPSHKGSAKNIKLGLDLAGGVSITYQTVDENPTEEELDDTVYKMQKRVENYSTESAVYKEGNNRINIDIPGESDADEVLAALGKAGSIEFKDEEGNVVINGSDIETAGATTQQGLAGTEYLVNLTLTPSGAKKFATATAKNIGKRISIVYDGQVIQSPVVQNEITDGNAVISGQNTFEEAKELASTIRIGALPLELTELRSNVVGAKLGTEAINTSLLAGFIGFILVMLFMIVMYRIPGVASSIALSLYVVAMLVTINALDVTLTLPGIAGIILSIGIAVDANVIIFTRIREELATGKTVRSSIKIGFDKALSAIVDGNVTTLIAAAVLWLKGSGTIKGFAQTLAIGIILSMFTALAVTKFVLYGLYYLGLNDVKFYGIQKEVKVFNFTKHTRKFAVISVALIAIGAVAMGSHYAKNKEVLNFGLDFKGGTSTEVTFEEAVSNSLKEEVSALVSGIVNETPEISEVKGSNALLIRTKALNQNQRSELSDKLVKKYAIDTEKITTETISGTVSSEMKMDAIISILIATVGMLLYIWIRFKDINFGSSAVIALVHDVLVVLMVYTVASISVGNTFIACMLTIVGYSINATIVIFDRIRENRAAMRNKDSMEDVVNNSISQTISRSINTSLTTFIMVFVLYILGVDSIKEFALPLMAGIICGAYSSICIAGTLWYFFRKKFSKKATA